MSGDHPRLSHLPALGDASVRAPGPSHEEVVDHPMRRITREIAFDPDGWGPARAAKVAEVFDGLAPTWHEIAGGDGRLEPLRDALDRGGVDGTGVCLELGSGTGSATALLAERFDVVLASDLSLEMLRRAAEEPAVRVQADACRLPVRTGAAHAVVLMNMFLFCTELERVLRPDGALVWISSLGDRTPIYLSPAEVLEALGPHWQGVAGRHGEASWCVARRRPS